MISRFYSQKQPKNIKENNHIYASILLVLFSALFATQAFREAWNMKKEHEKLEAIAKRVEMLTGENIPAHFSKLTNFDEDRLEHPATVLPQYAELQQQNPDLYGWIKIDNTVIDYPVMHTPNDPEKYLRCNFDGEKNMAGTIFMDYRCTPQSDNQILYGHNMKNGTMFGSLLNYQSQEYWKDHKVIHFDTLHEQQDFEVVAAFFDRIYSVNDREFKYYNFIQPNSKEEYDRAIHAYKEKALYDTGVSPHYGDQLLTLSTCSYHVEEGRFVVVAKKCMK